MDRRSRSWSRSRSRSRGRTRTRKHRKSRSRSCSPSGSGPNSHEREKTSKPPSPSTKKSKWDSAPDLKTAKIKAHAMQATMGILSGKTGISVHSALAVSGGVLAGVTVQEMKKMQHQNQQSRRIYLGGVQPHILNNLLRAFLDKTIAQVAERIAKGPACNQVQVNPSKQFAIVDLHHIQVYPWWPALNVL
jgi:hypothetical protein